MEKCDVLVVGAGASGSVAALKAVKEGLKTIVIEKKKKPGDFHTRIDITRDAGITDIVKELNLELGDHSKVSRWFSKSDSFILTSKIGDYFVKRGNSDDCFEVSTIHKAEDAGAELITGVRISSSKKEEGRVSGITLNSGEEIKPEHVIIATGQEPEVIRKLKIKMEEKNPVHFIAYGEIRTGLDMPKKISHIFFDSELIPHGYFYMGKNSEGLGVTSVVVSSDEVFNVKERYTQFIRHNKSVEGQLSNSERISTFTGSRYAADIGERVHGNVFLVGDGGRFMDPFVGYGVNQSIYTGYWAASAIKSGGPEAYKKAIKRTLDEIKQGRKARKVFMSLGNGDFDLLIDGMKELSKEVNVDDFLDNPGAYPLQIIKTAFKKPGLIPMLRHIVHLF